MPTATAHYVDEFPRVAAFVATLPADPERDHLVAEYRCLYATFERVSERHRKLSGRTTDTVNELVDATDQDRRELLLATYTFQSAERDALPRLRTTLARRHAHTLDAWRIQVRPQVVQEHFRRLARRSSWAI